MKQSLINSLINSIIIGAIFSSISILSTYWAKGKLAGAGNWPWTFQFLALWGLCSALIFIVDRIFPKK